MSFVAEASVIVAAPPARCFERLVDFPKWSRFMPGSFRPLAGPSRDLAVGDVVRVRLRGVPGKTPVKVEQLEPARLVVWSGGVPGLLFAMHAFHFEAVEGGTRIRSAEAWSGALAFGPVATRVRRTAEQVGAEQLGGLARDLELHPE